MYIQHFNSLDKAKFKTTHYRYPVYIEYMDRIFQFIECRHKIIIIADKYLNKLKYAVMHGLHIATELWRLKENIIQEHRRLKNC